MTQGEPKGTQFSFRQRTCSSYVSFIVGRESREITLRNARKKIEALAHQLSLRRDRIEMAFHFFKVIKNEEYE